MCRYELYFRCVDLNECAEGTHTCHENASCTDVVGGFTCECLIGFTGDGFVCTGIAMLDNIGDIK